MLKGWRRANQFETGLGAKLPPSYLKFWREWKETTPAAVHYIPKEGKYERNELTGEVRPIQNHHIPLQRVPEEDEGFWGGEAIIKGFQKRNAYKRRVPHFWVPVLKRSVLRSEILNEYFSMTVTHRTITQILEHHGFDHYVLKTPACDIRSLLALKLKQRILDSLQNNCPRWTDNPTRKDEIMKEYGKYLENYTPEDIEWYGLSWDEAIKKIRLIIDNESPIVPHKDIFRSRLVEQLRAAGIDEAQGAQ